MLFNGYHFHSRLITWFSVFLLLAAIALGTLSLLSFARYGVAAVTRAVIAWRAGTLRSVPTEADTSQKTSPLSAGSVAIVDKTFLGWVRLSFENGQTGWVRKEEVVGLWK